MFFLLPWWKSACFMSLKCVFFCLCAILWWSSVVCLVLLFLNSHFHSLHVSNEVHWDSNLVTPCSCLVPPVCAPFLARFNHTWWHVNHRHTFSTVSMKRRAATNVILSLSCTHQPRRSSFFLPLLLHLTLSICPLSSLPLPPLLLLSPGHWQQQHGRWLLL